MRTVAFFCVLLSNERATSFLLPCTTYSRSSTSTSSWKIPCYPSAVTAIRTGSRCCSNPLFGSRPRGESSNNDDFDVEAVRNQLEHLLEDDDDDDSDNSSTDMKKNRKDDAPLMSTIARERRQAEIQILQLLKDSDAHVPDLWTLWFGERGAKASATLQEVDDLVSEGPGEQWETAERILKEMIEEHGIHFVEPVNRLATLYFLQGRLQESRDMCELVLAVKPWHFGALSGIVMVCVGLHDDAGARIWASRRLPSLPATSDTDNNGKVENPTSAQNQRREAWVENAVDTAQKALVEEEERIRLSFGKKTHYDRTQSDLSEVSLSESSSNTTTTTATTFGVNPTDGKCEDEDAWQ